MVAPFGRKFIFGLWPSLGIHGCFGELYREGFLVRDLYFSAQASGNGKGSSSVLFPFLLRRAVTGRIPRPCCVLFCPSGRYREGFFVRAMSFSAQTGDTGKDHSSVLCPFLPRRAVTGRILRPCCVLFCSDER